jgi:serine/threonine protein kinase
MAPEQIEGVRESGPEGDVFALGSTLVWAATGRGPFAADQTAATLYRILSMPPDLDGVPPRVADPARACLAKDPARRPSAVQLDIGLRGHRPPRRTARRRRTRAQPGVGGWSTSWAR